MNNAITARFKLDYGEFQLSVNLSLPNSGITVLFGQSGSGKTTLLRCIAGLQKAENGFLEINGTVWQDSDNNVFLPTHQRPLGYVFQDANLFSHLNVRENLNFGLKRIKENPPTPPSKRGAFFSPLGKGGGGDFQCTKIINLLGIDHLLDRMPERLSGGEKQRVAIARALVLNPEVLLMDEPLASLDFKRKQEILPFLSRLNQELAIPVLYVTHSQQEVAQLANYLVVLEAGKVQAAGTLSETLSRLDLPLAQDRDATTVWNVTIFEHETDFHLTSVVFDGGVLSLTTIDAKIGTPLRVQIYARDVSIVLEIPRATSILNVLPAVIIDMADGESGQSIVRLAVGSQPLLAHITRKSAGVLNLKIGTVVFVQIKGTSILN